MYANKKLTKLALALLIAMLITAHAQPLPLDVYKAIMAFCAETFKGKTTGVTPELCLATETAAYWKLEANDFGLPYQLPAADIRTLKASCADTYKHTAYLLQLECVKKAAAIDAGVESQQ